MTERHIQIVKNEIFFICSIDTYTSEHDDHAAKSQDERESVESDDEHWIE